MTCSSISRYCTNTKCPVVSQNIKIYAGYFHSSINMRTGRMLEQEVIEQTWERKSDHIGPRFHSLSFPLSLYKHNSTQLCTYSNLNLVESPISIWLYFCICSIRLRSIRAQEAMFQDEIPPLPLGKNSRTQFIEPSFTWNIACDRKETLIIEI